MGIAEYWVHALFLRLNCCANDRTRVSEMGAQKQTTLKAPVQISGIGLHTGEECRLVINPRSENSGISFIRVGVGGTQSPLINADPVNVVRACHGTTLANTDGVSIATVEHVMAALAICSIDNAIIEVSGPEIPILDGSAAPFVEHIRHAGVVTQSATREVIVVESSIAVVDGDRSIEIEPSEKFQLSVEIDFEDCLIGRQSMSIGFDDVELMEQLARSRTFCRLYEVEALRAQNLIRGGSLENSIVVDGSKMLNNDNLRDPNEFVLHKALDLIGDLYLLGAPIQGRIRANKPGHDLNTRAALAISHGQAVGVSPVEQVAALA